MLASKCVLSALVSNRRNRFGLSSEGILVDALDKAKEKGWKRVSAAVLVELVREARGNRKGAAKTLEQAIALADAEGRDLDAVPVSTYVNNARHKDGRCIEPIGTPVPIGREPP